MNATLSPRGYYRLIGVEGPDHDTAMAWVEQVAPGRRVMEIEVQAEGRCRLRTTLAGDRLVVFRADGYQPVTRMGCPNYHGDFGWIERVVYTSSQPPEAVLRAAFIESLAPAPAPQEEP